MPSPLQPLLPQRGAGPGGLRAGGTRVRSRTGLGAAVAAVAAPPGGRACQPRDRPAAPRAAVGPLTRRTW